MYAAESETSWERIRWWAEFRPLAVTALICGTILMLAFRGEPDLMDGLIHFLMNVTS